MSGSWVILGATSAVARAFAREVAATGAGLLLLARDRDELEALAADYRLRGAVSCETVCGDMTELVVQDALAEKSRTLKGPVQLFSAVGLMPEQGKMLTDPALLATMMSANSTAIMQATNRLLPLFEDQQAGAIVLVGSVAGDRGRKKNFLYGSSKAALAAYAEGLAAHLSAFHVPVLLVKPGVLDTSMTWGLKNPPLPLGQPDALARAILKRVTRGKGGCLYFPWFWRYIMLIIRCLPAGIFNKLNF